ncbi:glutathione S-transferase family protein [Gloeocapsopsis dulcis]|uniref:Glutathione S-transferase n=1 Tax=Gloeocapsopsis dulcis AAB1 = 1H9 TaxID=1433147 RepID=A0A6N8FT47_9CHRO|nr:glutathione S-transferase family protein [Gloeocapsopsis dulcis]MUL35924.1 glutathione S-transferase [Gloeocapsopsis dulcis AAB1 = 1H9]WNN88182.1 glutathione S-transferase family protein [Gloeocapsopsis dulcis]
MLKLYYARPSAYARPVWLALLEKQLSFELIPVDLSGEQFEPEFLALNPFSHIPVLVDGDFRVIESLAILDYLEARYPERSLLPTDAIALAKVRMVQMVTLNELLPAVFQLLVHDEKSSEKSVFEYAQLRAINTLNYFEALLDNSPYFAGEQLTLAEIVAGTLVHRMPDLGIALTDYPKLNRWSDRLLARPTWQQIELSPEEWSSFKRRMRVIPKIWQRRRHQRINALSQQ